MKYTEMEVAGMTIKRVESEYIDIFKGHLVFEESVFFCADVVKAPNERINYGNPSSYSLTKRELLDLRACIDKALSNFHKIEG